MARRVLHDRYFQQAKREGYLARSAYKLIEIQERERIIRKGDRVLDLGCAPGSWLQVAAEQTGPDGLVAGIDLLPVVPSVFQKFGKRVRATIADVHEFGAEELNALIGEPSVNVVISDMAPNTSGHGDHFRSVRLCETVLQVSDACLAPRGNLIMKVFDGETLPELLAMSRKRFQRVRTLKPRASREVSKETYVICKSRRQPKQRKPKDTERGEQAESQSGGNA